MNVIDCRPYLNYSDVLIKPRVTTLNSRQEANLYRTIVGPQSGHTLVNIPIMVTNMDTVGTIKMALEVQKKGMFVALHKYHSATELIQAYKQNDLDNYHFVSIGQSDKDVFKLQQLEEQGLVMPPILIDVANGYTKSFLEFVAKVRLRFPKVFIAAGNVATPEVLHLYKAAGVDAVRIGIGPGGQCRTRVTAGVGIPQLTAVLDCAEEAKKLGLLTIADGGINEYADFGKAFGAGADIVCAGSIFAGSNEASGKIIWGTNEGCKYSTNLKAVTQYKQIYGMSTELAMSLHGDGIADYKASEGRVSNIPCTGPVADTIKNITGSIRSTMTYTNSKNIEELYNNVSFIRVQETVNRKYEKYSVGI